MRHILRVWRSSWHLGEEFQVVAILHDTIEDDATKTINPFFISTLFGWDIANAVNDLTRCEGEEYLTSYIDRVKANPLAKAVKILDLNDHLNRLVGDESNEIRYNTKLNMRKRYTKAMEILSHD